MIATVKRPVGRPRRADTGVSRKHTFKSSTGAVVAAAKLVLWVRADQYGTTIDDAEVTGPEVFPRRGCTPVIVQTAVGDTDENAIRCLFELLSRSNPALFSVLHRWVSLRAYEPHFAPAVTPRGRPGARAPEPCET